MTVSSHRTKEAAIKAAVKSLRLGTHSGFPEKPVTKMKRFYEGLEYNECYEIWLGDEKEVAIVGVETEDERIIFDEP